MLKKKDWKERGYTMSNDVIVRKCAGTGTSKVLFTCHRADYDMYFEMLRDDILEAADCTIFCFDDNDYYPEIASE